MSLLLQYDAQTVHRPAADTGLVSAMASANIALVAEGGGQRGIFTAGVLDAFMHQGYNPFRWMIGVSAGAQNVAAFALGEEGYVRKIIMELTTDARFFKPTNVFRHQPMIDLDWYFAHSQAEERYTLPIERLPDVVDHGI